MMKRDFEEMMNGLRETINDYSFYTDFDKVFKNVKEIEYELNILNYLLGKNENFDKEFIRVIEKDPDVLRVIPILLAVRDKKIKVYDKELLTYNFEKRNKTNEEYLYFVEKTGLKRLFTEEKIKNLVDYVTGVEVGLDSNARKSRTGYNMEKIVYDTLLEIKAKQENCKILKQVTKNVIQKEFNTNKLNNLVLDQDSNEANKRFDFAILTPKNNILLIETSFYNTQGSKLNETSRSYITLEKDIQHLNGVTFIWITDGYGWKKTKNNLHEAYQNIEHILTLDNLENLLTDIIKEN